MDQGGYREYWMPDWMGEERDCTGVCRVSGVWNPINARESKDAVN